MATPEAGEVYRQLAPAVLGYLRAQRGAEPEDLLGRMVGEEPHGADDVDEERGQPHAGRQAAVPPILLEQARQRRQVQHSPGESSPSRYRSDIAR